MAALSCAPESLSVKYQWPLAARVKFDTSPATHTIGYCVSTNPFSRATSAETVSGSVLSFGAVDMSFPLRHADDNQRVALLVAHPVYQFKMPKSSPVFPLGASQGRERTAW